MYSQTGILHQFLSKYDSEYDNDIIKVFLRALILIRLCTKIDKIDLEIKQEFANRK